MYRKLLACVPLAALVVLASSAPVASRQKERAVKHPRLHAALFELRQAHKELKDARGDFGGHRKKALELMESAIASVRDILEIKGDDPVGVTVRKTDFYRQHKTYPHLRQVLLDLKEARGELEDAKADFRGKKKDALRDLDDAIKQVRLAIDHAEDR